MFTCTQQKKKEQHEKNTHTSKITTCTYFARAKTLKNKKTGTLILRTQQKKKKNVTKVYVHQVHATEKFVFVCTQQKKMTANIMFACTQQKKHNRKKKKRT